MSPGSISNSLFLSEKQSLQTLKGFQNQWFIALKNHSSKLSVLIRAIQVDVISRWPWLYTSPIIPFLMNMSNTAWKSLMLPYSYVHIKQKYHYGSEWLYPTDSFFDGNLLGPKILAIWRSQKSVAWWKSRGRTKNQSKSLLQSNVLADHYGNHIPSGMVIV